MFGMGAATRIYVATGATGMRLGVNGLFGLVQNRLELDPLSGHLSLFANARSDRMKVTFFDGSGLWVCSRRIGRGRLRCRCRSGRRAKWAVRQECCGGMNSISHLPLDNLLCASALPTCTR
jgi:hypothetical protein